MLQRISHGPSHTMLPMIGASARNEHAPGFAAAPAPAGASGTIGTLALALPGIVPPLAALVRRGTLSRPAVRGAISLCDATAHHPALACRQESPLLPHCQG